MKKPIFTGASVAIVTPFKDEKINYEVLKKQIEFQIANGTDCITICGTTGESSVMTDEEHRECIKFAVDTVAGRIPVIAGTGSNDTAYALDLSLYAESVGVDGFLMVTPYYNKTTQRGLVKHYEYIADRVKTPIILYNVPSRTGMSFTVDTYEALSKHPNINGIKEASGDFSLIINTMARCGDELNIWSGNDDQVVPILALGGKGVISTTSNVLPREMHDICQLFFDGKIAESAALQKKCAEIIRCMFIEVNPIPVKTALNLIGFEVGELRMPLCDMAPANLESLKKALVGMGLEIK